MRVDQPDVAWGQGPHRRLLRVEGTVESMTGTVVNLRTSSGLVPIDVSRTGWKPGLNEHATIVYEEGGSGGQFGRLARWVERDAAAAMPRSLSGW